MKSLLPIIFVILVLTGAITFSLAKRSVPVREENKFGIAANELDTTPSDLSDTDQNKRSYFGLSQVTPTPTAFITPTPSLNPTDLPEVTEDASDAVTTKGGEVITEKVAQVTKTSKTTVCTPVYGAANTCTEHVVVDTGTENAIFFNFAGLSYLAGLAAFIKSKYA